MIPIIFLGVACGAARLPMLPVVDRDVPPVRAIGNAALMSPDERLAVDKLIDVELQRLCFGEIGPVEINVVSEIVQGLIQRMVSIGQVLRGKIADEVIDPDYI